MGVEQMGRRGRLAAAVAAGVLAGLAGPVGAATASTGFDGGHHGRHEVAYAVDFRAGSAVEGPGTSVRGPGVTGMTGVTGVTTSPTAEDPAPAPAPDPDPDGTMADTGAGILPWITAAAAGALGVGAVVFALVRRRSD